MGDSCLIRDEAPAFRRIPAPHPTLPPDMPAEEGPDCVAPWPCHRDRAPGRRPTAAPQGTEFHPPPSDGTPHASPVGGLGFCVNTRQCGRFQVQGAGLEPTAVRCPT